MKSRRKVIFFAFGLGLLAYFVEAVVDWLFFFDQSFWEILVTGISGHHLFLRLIYVLLILIFCGYAIYLLSSLQRMRDREANIKRVLLAIRNVNRLITHEKDQTRLLDEICRLLIDTRGFFNAWIVLVEDGQPVEPFHHMGFGGTFGEMTRRLLAGDLPLCGHRVLEKKALQVICRPNSECGDCPNRPIYHEDRAGLSVPLKHEETIRGWLTVSAPRVFAEDPEEQQLLIEVADDIGYALQNLRDVESLRESEEQFRSIYNTSADGILIFNLDGVVVAANPKAGKLYGYDEGEMIGLTGQDFVHPDYHPLFEEFKQLKEGVLFHGESVEIRKDGSMFNMEVRGSRFRYKGQPHLMALVTDVTDRKKAEADRERLLSAVEQSREIFVITDAEGSILYVNPAFTLITGYSRDEVLGQNPRILKSGEHDETFYAELWETISSGKPWQGRFVNKRKDGALYTEEATISPVRDATGRIVNYVGVKHDITRQLQVHDEKLQLEAQFQQAQKLESIGRLAGGVAHDLNNLLSPIIGYSEILLDDVSEGSPQRESLEGIIQAGMRARDLVGQLLAFSRKQVLDFQPIDINHILSWFEKLLRRTIREDVAIVIIPSPALPMIRGDASQLEQVIMNLVVNAQDAMPDGGEITITTNVTALTADDIVSQDELSPGRYVLLSVSDTGCGMDAGILEHLFEPFFTTKEKGKGTGLGLATAYGIIKQHNGGIRVTSHPDRGTTFQLFLPVTDETQAAETPDAKATVDLEGTETILLVEDDDQVRSLSRAVLQRQGYNVITAENGEAALITVGQYAGPVHLLLTDVIMPKMNGRELFERVSRQLSSQGGDVEMKVIYMSGYADDIIARHGVLEKGVNFIQKPFSVEVLALKVRNVLDDK